MNHVQVVAMKVVIKLVSMLVKKIVPNTVMALAKGLVLEPVHPAAALVA